jgi:hypothetical protein
MLKPTYLPLEAITNEALSSEDVISERSNV